jgi:hypothetical protein
MGGYGLGGGGSGASSGSSGLGYGPGPSTSSSGRASSSHSPTQHLLSPTGAAAALLGGGVFGGGRSRLATRTTPIDEDSAMCSDPLCSPDCGGAPATPDLECMSSVSSGDSSGAAAARALRQLECCDSSAMLTDIWSSLLPLASSTLVLEAAAENNSLDVIAP